ncbi:1-acyl-sn-glycerol-3-phosphate acyltransferase PLS1 [Jatropha curcas]|uniref:1-acyl-sn-glycerol-3-phosphate acyltransferase PLS1 n=1 Tax=Jatropha curcas TaxID=180498 RepID=UPI001895DECB|nr:1-acyl-sn-glycerol-3-phosphate acyltransferase PLS1 [Jatropha curcas]
MHAMQRRKPRPVRFYQNPRRSLSSLTDTHEIAKSKTLAFSFSIILIFSLQFCRVIMAVPAALAIVSIGVLFFVSGLIVNLVQGSCFLLIRPFSKSAYRKIVGVVTEILWLTLIWLMDWRAGLEIHLFTDSETYKLMGKEHALVMPNHISDADIFILWLLAQRFNCLRSALMVVKKSSMYIPIFGWAAWFMEYVFMSRSWAKDEKNLKSRLIGLQDFPWPFWLTIFTEGTRLTPDKLVASQKFAISKGLPVPSNVLIPRTKGFVAAVQYVRWFVPAIYDMTLAVPRGHRTPSFLEILKGRPTVVQIHLKRYPVNELPESEEGIAQWCKDRFVAKDSLLDEFQAKGRFESNEIKNIVGRSIKTLVVLVSLACIDFIGAMAVIQRFSLLSTWKGITSIVAGLGLEALFLHAVIEYTKLPPQASKASMPNGLSKH